MGLLNNKVIEAGGYDPSTDTPQDELDAITQLVRGLPSASSSAPRALIYDPVKFKAGKFSSTQFDPFFSETESKYGLPRGALKPIAFLESAFREDIISGKTKSSTGATGLMQFMPDTAKRFNVADPTDPVQSIDGAGKYMSELLKRYKGDISLAYAAYHAGEGNVDNLLEKKPNGVGPLTKTYARKAFDLFTANAQAEEAPAPVASSSPALPDTPEQIQLRKQGGFSYDKRPAAEREMDKIVTDMSLSSLNSAVAEDKFGRVRKLTSTEKHDMGYYAAEIPGWSMMTAKGRVNAIKKLESSTASVRSEQAAKDSWSDPEKINSFIEGYANFGKSPADAARKLSEYKAQGLNLEDVLLGNTDRADRSVPGRALPAKLSASLAAQQHPYLAAYARSAWGLVGGTVKLYDQATSGVTGAGDSVIKSSETGEPLKGAPYKSELAKDIDAKAAAYLSATDAKPMSAVNWSDPAEASDYLAVKFFSAAPSTVMSLTMYKAPSVLQNAYLLFMGASTTGNNAQELIDRGVPKDAAMWAGAYAGLIEIGTEKMGLDVLGASTRKFLTKQVLDTAAKKALALGATIVVNQVTEAGEEAVSQTMGDNVGNWLAAKLADGRISKPLRNELAGTPFLQNVEEAALGGALGGTGAAVGAGAGTLGQNNQLNKIQFGINSLINTDSHSQLDDAVFGQVLDSAKYLHSQRPGAIDIAKLEQEDNRRMQARGDAALEALNNPQQPFDIDQLRELAETAATSTPLNVDSVANDFSSQVPDSLRALDTEKMPKAKPEEVPLDQLTRYHELLKTGATLPMDIAFVKDVESRLGPETAELLNKSVNQPFNLGFDERRRVAETLNPKRNLGGVSDEALTAMAKEVVMPQDHRAAITAEQQKRGLIPSPAQTPENAPAVPGTGLTATFEQAPPTTDYAPQISLSQNPSGTHVVSGPLESLNAVQQSLREQGIRSMKAINTGEATVLQVAKTAPTESVQAAIDQHQSAGIRMLPDLVRPSTTEEAPNGQVQEGQTPTETITPRVADLKTLEDGVNRDVMKMAMSAPSGSRDANLRPYRLVEVAESALPNTVPTSTKLGVRLIAKAFGKRVSYIADANGQELTFHGVYGGDSGGSLNTIYLDSQGTPKLTRVVGHEILHALRTQAPDVYSTLEDAVAPLLNARNALPDSESRDGKDWGEKGSHLREEHIADLIGDEMVKPSFWLQMTSKLAYDAANRFLGGALNKLDRVVSALTGQPLSRETSQTFKQARNAVVAAMKEYKARVKSGKIQGAEAELKYRSKDQEDASPLLAMLTPKDIEDRLRRRANRKAGIGKPKNERLTFGKGDNKFVVGQVSKDDWLARVEASLDPATMKNARNWYTQLHDFLSPHYGEKAPQYALAWLLSQKRASPSQGMHNVLRAENMAEGKAKVKQAGLNEKALIQAIRGEAVTGGVGAKLMDFVDSELGNRRRAWMGFAEEGRQPAAIDVWALRDAGFVDDAVHAYIVKTFGVMAAEKVLLDTGIGETNYEYGIDFYNDIAEWLNAKNYDGGNWVAREVQAVGWVSMQKAMGIEAEFVSDIIDGNTRRVSIGLGPGAGTALEGTLLGGEITPDQAMKTVNEIAEKAGVKILASDIGVGAYLTSVEGSIQIDAFASTESVADFMDMLGYALQQTEMISTKVLKSGSRTAVDLFSPDFNDLTVARAWFDEFIKAQGAKVLAPGFQQFTEDGEKGIRLINFDGKWQGERLSGIMAAAHTAAKAVGINITDALAANVRLESTLNDWTKQPNGEAYRASLENRGRVQESQWLADRYPPSRFTLGIGEGSVKFSRKRTDESQVNTPEFKAWFGDSKVVDENGDPLVMYHGTAGDFNRFRSGGSGIFLTPDPDFANAFADSSGEVEGFSQGESGPVGSNVMPVYVKAEKPFDYENPADVQAVFSDVNKYQKGAHSADDIASGDFGVIESYAVQSALARLGYDSFYVEEGGVKNIGVFRSTQIKSAIGNNGNFDSQNPDIRYKAKELSTNPQVNTSAFKKWFGNSKVVDADGKPLVVYHGTSDDFTEFDIEHKNKVDAGWLGRGFYATDDAQLASSYTRIRTTGNAEANVMPLFLSLKNPLQLELTLKDTKTQLVMNTLGMDGVKLNANKELAERIREVAISKGYDGVILKYRDGTKEYVAFSPNQVKSATGNNGNFDSQNPDIRYKAKELSEAQGVRTNPQVNTAAFKKWFGDSKVVDAEGKPLVVYHGTQRDFNKFNPNAEPVTQGGMKLSTIGAIFFSSDKQVANNYTGVAKSTLTDEFYEYPKGSSNGGNVIPVYLSLKDPKVIDAYGLLYSKVEHLIREAKDDGYDGVILKNVRDQSGVAGQLNTIGHDAYIAFEPNQVKSAIGNNGNFDSQNPDIRYKAKELTEAQGQQLVAKWTAFAHVMDEDLYRYPRSEAADLKTITKDVSGGRASASDVTGWFDNLPADRTVSRIEIPKASKIGVNTTQDSFMSQQGKDVWINVASLTEGSGGSLIYSIVGNYAYNNGLRFVADPDGVSVSAQTRRLINMLSLATKFNNTDFLKPHQRQLDNLAELGFDWKQGDFVFNLHHMLVSAYNSVLSYVPEMENVDYNFETGEFTRNGEPFTAKQFEDLADEVHGTLTAGAPGSGTLKTGAVIGSILRQVDGSGLSQPGLGSAEDLRSGVRGILYSRKEDGPVDDSQLRYSRRKGPPPTKTKTGYKLFRTDKSGTLFPLFIDANTPVPVDEWLDADIGDNEKSRLGKLALRPGWHLGDTPSALHIGEKANKADGFPSYRSDNQVWARVEYAADIDWQPEANSRGTLYKTGPNKGKLNPSTAEIKGEVPKDGFYRYKTNSNMAGDWIITGAMRVVKVLSDTEVTQINEAAGTQDLPRRNPDIRFARKTSWYYSQLAKAFDDQPDRIFNQPAKQLAVWLQSNAAKLGIKQEEIQWSGITDWLTLQGSNKATKAEVLNYLKQNGVQVTETRLGGTDFAALKREFNARGLDFVYDDYAKGFQYYNLDDESSDVSFYGLPVALRELITKEGDREPEYAKLIEPGVSDEYTELVLQLPNRDRDAMSARFREIQDKLNTGTFEEDMALMAEREALYKKYTAATEKTFEAPHFTGLPNILAHLRFTSRSIPDGGPYMVLVQERAFAPGSTLKFDTEAEALKFADVKKAGGYRVTGPRATGTAKVMLLEESQSDWAQQGRKLGFAEAPAIREIKMTDVPGVDFSALDYKSVFGQGSVSVGDVGFEGNTRQVFFVRNERNRFVLYHMGAPLIKIGSFKTMDELKARVMEMSIYTHDTQYGPIYRSTRSELAAFLETKTGIPRAPFVQDTKSWTALVLKRAIVYAVDHGFDKIAWTTGQQQSDRYSLRNVVDKVEVGGMDAPWLTDQDNRLVRIVLKDDGDNMDFAIDRTGKVVQTHSYRSEQFAEKNLEEIIGKTLTDKILSSTKAQTFEGDGLEVGGEGMLAYYDHILPQVASSVLKKLGGGPLETIQLSTKDGIKASESFKYTRVSDVTKNQVTIEDSVTGAVVAGPFTGPNQMKESQAWLDLNELARKTPQQGFSITPAMKAAVEKGLPLFAKKVRTPTGSQYALSEEDLGDAAIRTIQNDQLRWKQQIQAIKDRGGIVNDGNNVYQAMERMVARAMNTTLDFYRAEVEPTLKEMSDAKITLAELGEYLYAAHAKERNREMALINPNYANTTYTDVGGSGMSDQEADLTLARFRSRPDYADITRFATRFRSWSDQNLTMLVNGGLISQAQAVAMRAKYPNYVPLRGFHDASEIDEMTGLGGGFSTGKRVVRRALGRSSRAGNPATYVIHSVAEAVLAQAKAEVGQYLEQLVKDNPDPALWTIDQPKKEPVFVDNANGGSVGERDMGFDPDAEVRFIRNGKEVRIQLKDALLARAYNNRGAEEVGAIVRASSTINSFLRQMWTQKNPVFPIVNVVRDIPAGILYATGEHGFSLAATMVKDIPGAWVAMLQYSMGKTPIASMAPWVAEYRAAGGGTGFRMVGDIQNTMDRIAQIEKRLGNMTIWEAIKAGKPLTAAQRVVWRTYNNVVFDFIEHINEAFENMTRLALFKAARERGLSVAEAARLSKNATVNFNRRGEASPSVNGLYLFFNASVQNLAKDVHTLTESDHKGQARVIMGLYASLGFALAMMAANGDDDLENEEENIRSIKFRIGDLAVSIPLSYGVLGFSYYLGRSAAKLVLGEDLSLQSIRLASALFSHMTPLNPIGNAERVDLKNAAIAVTPTALSLPMQVVLNRNSWGQDMMPDYRPTDPDAYKSFRGTRDSTYAVISAYLNENTGGDRHVPGMVDVSPETIKGLVHFAFGGSGKFVADTITTTGDLLEGDLNLNQIPLANRFVKQIDVTDYRARFYREAGKAKDDLALYNKYAKDGNAAKAISLEERAALGQSGNQLWERMNDLRDQELKINQDKTVSLTERKRQIAELRAQQMAISNDFHQWQKPSAEQGLR